MRRAFGLYVAHPKLSFADCYHVALMESLKSTLMVSFDRKLSQIPTIVRPEPDATGSIGGGGQDQEQESHAERERRPEAEQSVSRPARSTRSEDTLWKALDAIGAWSDIDWDELADELDRIRHESRPTPPIDFDDV